MKIGDLVRTKKIDPVTQGVVKGVIDSQYFSKWYEGTVLQPTHSQSLIWHELFPGFMDKTLVFVEFKQKYFFTKEDESGKLHSYDHWITSTMYYPIDALEVVDQ